MLATALFGAASITTPAVYADDANELTSEQINAIVQRLEQAEREIQELRLSQETPAEIQAISGVSTDIYSPDPSVFFDGAASTVGPTRIAALEDVVPNIASPGDTDKKAITDADIAARLSALEDQWAAFDYETQIDTIDALNDDVGGLQSDAKDLVKRGTSNASAQIFGRIHLDYLSYPNTDAGATQFEGENPQDRFLWRRLRFGVKGKISDQMFYKLEMEFPDPNDFEFRDMYIGWSDVPFLQTVILGNHKRPFGLDHLNSSRYNIFTSRPNVIEAFNEDTRRLGISANGISDDLAYNWRYGVWQLERTQDDGQTFGNAYQLQVAGRMAHTYWWDEPSDGRGYAHFAFAGAYADPDENGGPRNANEARFRTRPEARTGDRWLNTGRISNVHDFQIAALEHVYNRGAFQWVSEYQGLWVERDNGSPDTMFHGGYTYVAYMLTGEHVPWTRKTGTIGRVKPFENFFWVDKGDGTRGRGWGAWQVAFRYSYLDMNDADIFGGVANSYTTSLVWYWNENASVQLNWIHGAIRDADVVNGRGQNETGRPAAVTAASSDYDMLHLRFRIDY